MRILLICPNFETLGGVQEVVDSLAEKFAAAGHTVAVISTPGAAGPRRMPRANVEIIRLDQIPPYKPVTLRHLERLVRRRHATTELIDRLRRWRPDVVNSHGAWYRLPTLAYVCRAIDVPLVHSIQGISPGAELDRDTLEALADTCTVTAISRAVKEYFEQFSPVVRDARVIVGGVDCEAARCAAPTRRERPYIFSAARLLLRSKALDVLISAFGIIAARHPELDLVITGDGPDRERLEGQIAAAGLGPRAEILGVRPRGELWSLHKGATLFAMPSRWPEGLGLVFLEAMACGVPVIGTKSGGTPEIVLDGETGLLIERNEPEELAAAIRTLLDDSELTARLRRRGAQLAAEYDWSKVAARYLELYSRLGAN
ncbi:MAG: glycosyltransferase family 4 protein [Candidatus Binataceae bacterium]